MRLRVFPAGMGMDRYTSTRRTKKRQCIPHAGGDGPNERINDAQMRCNVFPTLVGMDPGNEARFKLKYCPCGWGMDRMN